MPNLRPITTDWPFYLKLKMGNNILESNLQSDYFRYWGKAKAQEGSESSYHLLPYHCLDVAACGSILLSDQHPWINDLKNNLGISKESIRRQFTFFLCLHDLGKFSRAFQGQASNLSDELVAPTSNIPYSVRHDSLGYWLWRESDIFQDTLSDILQIDKTKLRPCKQIRTWFEIVTGHHGQPPKPPDFTTRLESHYISNDIEAACQFLKELTPWHPTEEDAAILQDKQTAKKLKKESWRLAGLAVLADWLGSNQNHFKYLHKRIGLQEYWTNYALPAAKTAIDNAQLIPPKSTPFTSITQLFPFIQTPTPLQRYALEQPLSDAPQLFILEDVTGAGKTEAAMTIVHRLLNKGLANGLYVGLPTMATANAMYQRLAECYQKLFNSEESPSLVLAHGARHLSEAFTQSIAEMRSSVPVLENQPSDSNYDPTEESASAYCNAWFADNRKKALLADIGVGTIDQSLLAVLPARHQALRVLGLGRKVLLVDEVHAYDPYMKRLLENLLELHAGQGGSVILLSATLPQRMKTELLASFAKGLGIETGETTQSAYPLATHFDGKGAVLDAPLATRSEVERKVQIKRLDNTHDAEALIAQTAKEGKCACWIRNTVDDARESFDRLSAHQDIQEAKLHLFHSRFAMQDRQTIETNVLGWFGKESNTECRSGRVLISTQVVEQSLDLDFDVLITDLAPIDLLLQRAGRLQRHLRDKHGDRLPSQGKEQRYPPILYILSPQPADDANESWLNQHRGTLAVYQDPGQLWRSAKTLFDKGHYRMPQDARDLIESVYSASTSLITPESIKIESCNADGERRAATSMANLNMLHLEKGYTINSNESGWGEEVNIPTRLSDKTTSVVLVKPKAGGGWQPYADDPYFAWDFSALKIRESLWKQAEEAIPDELRAEMEALRDQHKVLRWHSLFPLMGSLNTWYSSESGWLGNSGGNK